MTDIYFVRHGESTANRDKICAGHTDVDLTDAGRQQAGHAGDQITEAGISVDRIISSPLKRAFGTAQIIAEKIGYEVGDIVVSDFAIERFRGRYEGQPGTAQDGATEEDYARMGAESIDAMVERSIKLREQIEKLGVKAVLVVSHNHFGRVFVAVMRGELHKDKQLEKLPNAHVFRV